jgi:uncharacterized phage protein (TIGR01671 family)
MREIDFRGQREDTGEWVYGDLTHLAYGIITIQGYIVIPETIGQYTGLKDKNGKNIFEGDMVKDDSDNTPTRYLGYEGVVKFTQGAFLVDGSWENDLATIGWEVIGNIHDQGEEQDG